MEKSHPSLNIQHQNAPKVYDNRIDNGERFTNSVINLLKKNESNENISGKRTLIHGNIDLNNIIQLYEWATGRNATPEEIEQLQAKMANMKGK